jgi:hypothetical protein
MTVLVLPIVIGVLLLLFGRRLFWLYVAACGLAVGVTLATRIFSVQPDWLALLIGLGAGALGALLAVFFQGLAIRVGGSLAGAFIAVAIAKGVGFEGGASFWVMFVLGGIIGTMLMVVLFDWGLIVLSCLLGSSLIVPAFRLAGTSAFVLWAGLFGLGVAAQAAMRRHERG